jgi:hypothetical protein
MTGDVRVWNGRWGLITLDAGLPDLFFLRSSVIGIISAGDEVNFWLGDNPRGNGLIGVEVQRTCSGRANHLRSRAFSASCTR